MKTPEPSPWRATHNDHDDCFDIIVEEEGEENGWYEVALGIEWESTAVMLSKAPEMLELLRGVSRGWTNGPTHLMQQIRGLIKTIEEGKIT
jgi:hypothetical protein